MDKVHVAFALDRKYIQHLSVALYSLLTNNRNLNFNVYLISDGIGKQELKRIEFICDKFKHKLVNTNVKGNIFDNLITNYHFTKAIYYKLLIPEYIDSEKVLFIDSDTVVNNSVSDLYSIDIGNAFLAAIENPGFYRHNQLCMDSNSKYFNSGIMFINSIKWREEKLYERVLEFIKIHSDNIRFPEQDGLNAVINGNWIPLPPKFNLQTSMLEKECSCFSKLELDEARKKPIIIHYTGSSKPWHFMNNHPYKKLYWKYLSKTPFKIYIPADLTFINVIKKMMPSKIKQFLKYIFKLSNKNG